MPNMNKTIIVKSLPDKLYLKLRFRKDLHKKLNLKSPVTFNEKLQWLKLYDRNPEYIKMVDKYEVKKYVSELIGEEFVIPNIGIWDKFEDINFDELPDKFVLKCTHDSGGIVICDNKADLDLKSAEEKINSHLLKNYYYMHREWPYKNVKPRILAEKYMVDESGNDLKDYKVFCFNGKAKYIQVHYDRFNGHKRNIYDRNWNLLNVQYLPHYIFSGNDDIIIDKGRNIEKPLQFEQMIELAEKLAGDIPFVRIDFYSITNRIYFGEITLYPAAGFGRFIPEEYDKIFGNEIKLPNKIRSEK